MFERFTEAARRVIFFALHQAAEMGTTVIETEHLLVGLLQADEKLMKAVDAPSMDVVRRSLVVYSSEKPKPPIDGKLSNESASALKHAAVEADRLGTYRIGNNHFLVGLMLVEGSAAWKILQEAGLTVDRVRALGPLQID